MPSACRLRRVDRVVWAREAKEARVEPRRARDTSEGNAAPAADRNRQKLTLRNRSTFTNLDILKYCGLRARLRCDHLHLTAASWLAGTRTRSRARVARRRGRRAALHLTGLRHSWRRNDTAVDDATRKGTPFPRARTRVSGATHCLDIVISSLDSRASVAAHCGRGTGRRGSQRSASGEQREGREWRELDLMIFECTIY